jgi:hypothetical protein
LILNLAIECIDNKFKGAKVIFRIVNLKMRTIIALFLGVAAGIKMECAPCAAPSSAKPVASQLKCPCVANDSQGYGKISSRSKGQSQSAARADNQFEQEDETLNWDGNFQEAENGESQGSGYEISTQYITINGEYNAEEAITDTQAAKVGETGKAANCFRRESSQHLNEIAGQQLPEPLSGRDLGDCDCQEYIPTYDAKDYRQHCLC